MSMTGEPDAIDSVARTSQIIAAALIAGVTIFLGMSVALGAKSDAPAPAGGAAAAGPAHVANAGPEPAPGQTDLGQLLALIALALAAVTLPLSVLIPRLIADQNRRRIAAGTWTPPTPARRPTPVQPATIGAAVTEPDAGKLANVYATQFILGAALNEGPAFFACLAYLIGHHPLALGLAALLLGILISRFPTRPRIDSWIARQQELLIQDRQAAA